MRTSAIASALVAASLLLWLAGGPAGSGTCGDEDGDGVSLCTGAPDNCALVPNGPLLGTAGCISQEDGDADGYGNACDTDVNNDGATGLDDVGLIFDQAVIGGTDPAFDFNCDGATGLDDLGRAFDDAIASVLPGPSQLVCAGVIPCP